MDALPTTKHEKIKLVEINEYLTCALCKGYYIDATTISECLHSFCRSCIIQFLQENSHCPICEVIINKAKPNIKLDKTLQDIVYKLVPELFLREMARRQHFYSHHPDLAAKVTPEERGEDTERTIFNPKDLISLSIEYISDDSTPGAICVPVPLDTNKNSKNCDSNDSQMKRFLQCPGMCRIEVLKKFVQNKYNVNTVLFHIEILYKRVPLPNHYTLIDIAYIYSWKRNEPMKFFFRIMEKSAVEKVDSSENLVIPEIFVKPTKTARNLDKTKTNRVQKKKIASPDKKVLDDKNDMILNTDKIKDEIKNKLQDIGKGPVYTNITLNRSNNVEIITKVQKVSNKNGQPIGLNIIKQTVKKTTRIPEKCPEKQVTNGCKVDNKILKSDDSPRSRDEPMVSEETRTRENAISESEVASTKQETKDEQNIRHISGGVKETFDQHNDNKENRKEKPDEPKLKIENIKEDTTSEVTTHPIKEDKKDDHRVVIQTILQKKDFDIDEEKSNFLKSIELTARSALQTLQSLKTAEKPPAPPPIPSNINANLIGGTSKSAQKRKNPSPIKNERKKPRKSKTFTIKSIHKEVDPSMDKIVKLAEKQRNGGDLQSLFSSCKINIPSSLSITLKESSEDDRDRRNLASLRPVQNYIEILKLPDIVQLETDNRFKSKSAPNLPCKVPNLTIKDGVYKQQVQTFQKMFEESIKKSELTNKISIPGNKSKTEDNGAQNPASKRNLMEIASQLQKKTKLESERTPIATETLPKVPIPRLNTQKRPIATTKTNQMKFQQTFANLHSPSLGMNYTVSVAQNAGKSPMKIEAKVENSLRSPTKKREDVAENLVKKTERSSLADEHKSNGKILFQNAPSPRPNATKHLPAIPNVPSPRGKFSPEKVQGIPTSSTQNPPISPAFNPNHILEKYNIQNLAQLTASLNFNSAVFGMNHTTSQLAALQQAMLLKQFEMHNRQNWQLSQYEKYLQNRLLSKEN